MTFHEMTLKQRLVYQLHNEIIFGCKKNVKEGEFHTCIDCSRKADKILMFFEMEFEDARK